MVVAKIMNAGYYWPGMHEDAVKELQKCMPCQKHAPLCHRPKNNLIPVQAAWPFQKWGIDISGPFPEGPGRVKYLLVAVDYFTKWVEAKPLAKIATENVKKFIMEQIICRFGLPLYLISDNGTQFTDRKMQTWCQELKIQQVFTSVAHPQGNGQIERINRSIGDGLRRRVEQSGNNWVDELPYVLWAHRTLTKTSTGETPYSLTYGSEAVIPAEIGEPSARVRKAPMPDNDDMIKANLDLLEERRDMAAIREAQYKRVLEKFYNSRVKTISFKEGEYVLRSNEASNTEPTGKLGPNWEGPYVINKVLGKGAYTLKKMDGKDIPRTWNAAQLRKCYM